MRRHQNIEKAAAGAGSERDPFRQKLASGEALPQQKKAAQNPGGRPPGRKALCRPAAKRGCARPPASNNWPGARRYWPFAHARDGQLYPVCATGAFVDQGGAENCRKKHAEAGEENHRSRDDSRCRGALPPSGRSPRLSSVMDFGHGGSRTALGAIAGQCLPHLYTYSSPATTAAAILLLNFPVEARIAPRKCVALSIRHDCQAEPDHQGRKQ